MHIPKDRNKIFCVNNFPDSSQQPYDHSKRFKSPDSFLPSVDSTKNNNTPVVK